MIYPFLMTLVISSLVASQVVLKYGQHSFYIPHALSSAELIHMMMVNLQNPFFIASILITFLGGLAWILVLREVPLSKAYALLSIHHVFVYLCSCLLFGESMTFMSGLSVACIVIGTFFLGIK